MNTETFVPQFDENRRKAVRGDEFGAAQVEDHVGFARFDRSPGKCVANREGSALFFLNDRIFHLFDSLPNIFPPSYR